MQASAPFKPAGNLAVGLLTSLCFTTLLASCDGADEPAPQPTAATQLRTAPSPQFVTAEHMARLTRERAAVGLRPLQAIDESALPTIDVALPDKVDLPSTVGLPDTIEAQSASDVTTVISALPAGTPGALSPCMVDFNQAAGIAHMPDQAYTTFTGDGGFHYQHWCNNNGYLVLTYPINMDHYHLIPEAANYCSGTKPKMGTKSGSQCINQVEGKLVPRFAMNMNNNSGVRFWVKSAGNVSKQFDLKSIVVKSGSMEIYIAKSNGWWYWTGLGPAYWEFPQGDNIGEIRIYASGLNGTVGFDNSRSPSSPDEGTGLGREPISEAAVVGAAAGGRLAGHQHVVAGDLRLRQQLVNPVAVANVAYGNANRMSNANGDWPAAIESASRGARLSRQLVVFNDTFAGTAVDVSWEMHEGTAGGAIADQGSMRLAIPLAQRQTVTIGVTTPASGSAAVLVLQSSKDGRVIFRDDGQQFRLQ